LPGATQPTANKSKMIKETKGAKIISDDFKTINLAVANTFFD
jgi:hypothetical protein